MIIGIITVIVMVIIGLIISNSSIEKNSEESEVVVKGDIIMSTKSSRPGCEKTDRCYIPSVIVIDSGNPVTWVNEDSAFHSVTSGKYESPNELFDSGHLDPYEIFSYKFEEPGMYPYYCTLHPWMAGQIKVESIL